MLTLLEDDSNLEVKEKKAYFKQPGQENNIKRGSV
jgi:hypothetical protein